MQCLGGAGLTVSPQRTDFVLTSDIPYGEANVLVFYSLNVETCMQQNGSISARKYLAVRCLIPQLTDSRNRRDDFTKFEFIQNGCFSGGVESNHQDTHFFVAP